MLKTSLFTACFLALAVFSLQPAQAQEPKRYTFTLGLKAKQHRTPQAMEDMEKRLARRCRAAMFYECRFSIDRMRNELEVRVSSTWSLQEVQGVLTARGALRVYPTASNVRPLLSFFPEAKDPIDWERDAVGERGEDIYFHSKDGAALQHFTRTLQERSSKRVGTVTIKTGDLADYTLWVGPALVNDRIQGYRTYATRGAAPLTGAQLEGVHVLNQGNPPFFALILRWSEETTPDATSSPAQALQTLTRQAKGGRLLLAVDSQTIGVVSVPDEVTNGELRVRMPSVLSPNVQQKVARQLAGRIAGGTHPSDVVVVRAVHGR